MAKPGSAKLWETDPRDALRVTRAPVILRLI